MRKEESIVETQKTRNHNHSSIFFFVNFNLLLTFFLWSCSLNSIDSTEFNDFKLFFDDLFWLSFCFLFFCHYLFVLRKLWCKILYSYYFCIIIIFHFIFENHLQLISFSILEDRLFNKSRIFLIYPIWFKIFPCKFSNNIIILSSEI